jgi:N-acyl-D-aspartate/D-glutamate deacylase
MRGDDMAGLVLSGGRVADPASGMDRVGDVAMLDGRIAAVGTGLGGAERVVDATGLVVAPGFIDLHAHGQSIPADRMQAFDGVTTTLDLEAGVMPVASWYRRQEAQGRVLNYGASTNWAFARIGAMTGSNEESSLEAFGRAMRDRRWVQNVASEAEVARILDRLAHGLDEGGIGIGILNAYAPGAGVQELAAVCELAAAHGVPTFTHVAYMSRTDPESAAEAYIRLIGYAGATGAHMHICHFNSSSKTDVERCARLVAKAQAQGLPITVEAYPYGTGSTVLAAAFFSDPEFEARNGTGYDSVQRVTDGRRFRNREELLAAQAAEPSTLVLWHILDTENNEHHRRLLDLSVLFPGGAIASDAMPWSLADGTIYTGDAWPLPEDATSHPRSAGTFTRFLRHWVRERQAISLLDGVRKCALIPAEILQSSTPAMRGKGRLQPGADGDVVVFDLEMLTDRAEFSAMDRPAEGVRHLLVGGQPVITDGVMDVAARPGRPVRRPVAADPSDIVRNLMDPVIWREAPLWRRYFAWWTRRLPLRG